MCPQRKVLEKRFRHIKSAKHIRRCAGVIGILAALALLSTCVFASGILQSLIQDNYTTEVRFYDGRLSFTNQPFVKDGTVYLPLCETLDSIGIRSDDSIVWGTNDAENTNIIAVLVPTDFPYHYGSENTVEYGYTLTLNSPSVMVSGPTEANTGELTLPKGVPVMIEDVVYVPYQFFYGISISGGKRLTDYGFEVSAYGRDATLAENITPPLSHDFTPEEIASAQAVVEAYFRAQTAKDWQATLATMTSRNNLPNVKLFNGDSMTLLNIHYDTTPFARTVYIENGAGQGNGTSFENVLVFFVDYEVSLPDGEDAAKYAPLSEGIYKDCKMILIREDKFSPWLIDDQGY